MEVGVVGANTPFLALRKFICWSHLENPTRCGTENRITIKCPVSYCAKWSEKPAEDLKCLDNKVGMQGGFEDFGQKVDLTQRIREVLQVTVA